MFAALMLSAACATVPPGAAEIANLSGAYPDWSPDGEHLVYQADANGDGSLWVLRRFESRTGQDELLYQAAKSATQAAWSPDGSMVAFVSGDADTAGDIHVLELSSGEIRVITEGPERDIHPNWAPDGSGLLVNRQDADGKLRLWSYTFATERMQELPLRVDGTQEQSFPRYSPDGSRILFVGWIPTDDDEQADVFVAAPDGSEIINLTMHAAFDGWPTWSPDGESVVFASYRSEAGGADLYEVEVGSGELTRLTASPGLQDARATYAPDGRSIAFNRLVDGEYLIMQLRCSAAR